MIQSTSDSVVGRGRGLLDSVYHRLPDEPSAAAMNDLLVGLCEIRRELSDTQWRMFCDEIVAAHELNSLIREDPFTRHSADKPRGYAGDAVLLDYIYGYREPKATDLGRRIFQYTTNTACSCAVRERAGIIADIADRVARQRDGGARILSIACGHLREADLSQAMQQGQIAEYVVFDQDEESLTEVERRYRGGNVRVVRGSIGELLMGKHKLLRGFDFVYAAGLYDYLSQKLATRLTTWMFNATRPGGITLLTNYLPDRIGIGYMEAFMRWNLIYRTPAELKDTLRRIPVEQIGCRRTYIEENERVVFVEVEKALAATRFDDDYQPLPARRNGHARMEHSGTLRS